MFCAYRSKKLARPAWKIYCVCAFFQLWWHYLRLPWSISPQPCNPEQRKWSHKTIFCILTVTFEFAGKHKANSYWVLWVPHCIVCKPKPPIQKKVKAFFATDHFSLLVLTWVQPHWHFPLRPFMETRVREGKLSHWNHVEIFPAQWL